ncbi:MAG: FHA domain-containing protein [Anaerolineaceae bacterium]|nr:MAG: FHA domain-containing protein [Anaerolineaceae bacterium]
MMDDNRIPPPDNDDDSPTLYRRPIAPINAPVRLSLEVVTPLKARGRVFLFAAGQVIGRKDADVLINDKRVSRQHARINAEKGEGGAIVLALYDFGTPNGTFINGQRVMGRGVVRSGDEIRMGDHVFTLRVID